MQILPIMMVLAAWMIPILRFWVSRRKAQAQGHSWLLATSVCFALFYTSLQDGSTDLLAWWLGRGTVYVICSLTAAIMLIALLRYQRIYQQAVLPPRSHHIPALHAVHRVLLVNLLLASFIVFIVEGVWFRAWIDERNYTPLAIVLDRGPLVISRVCLIGAIIVGLWGGMIYPYMYLVWHRRRLDPAFCEQGGHWRLACFAGTTFITTISGLVHGSTTVLSYVQSQATDTWLAAANWISTVNGPILVTGILISCLPQHMYWSAQAYRLYHRLLPLHVHMRKLVEGIYLEVPEPKIWEIVTNPVQPIIALKRVHAEITDARFLCYGEVKADSTPVFPDGSPTTMHHPAYVARYERDVLCKIAQGGACPSEAKHLNKVIYQSLDYYQLLARMLRFEQGVDNAVALRDKGMTWMS